MKSQDLIFTVVLFIIVILKGRGAWASGMISLVLAALLFAVGNLFTAQRLTWYAAGFFAVSVIQLSLKELRKHSKKN